MGPSEIQELLDFRPFVPFRMTLSSGDIVDVRQWVGVSVTGLTMSIHYTSVAGGPDFRLVSLPNIALIQPIEADLPFGGRSLEEGS
jgi:hypothetical protein